MIFPGQGAQYIGMGKDFYEQFPTAKNVFEEAEDILSTSLTSMIFSGDPKEISLTKNSQIAIYVTSIAILMALQAEFGEVTPIACGGLSLGEYTALTAAKKLIFQDGLKLVQARGLYMHEASLKEPGTMAAVLGMSEEMVAKALEGLPVWVANINCEGQIVISGRKEAFEAATSRLKEAGAKRVIPLDVSGAFHTELMNSAKEKLEPKMRETLFHTSEIPVVMNVPGNFANDEDIQENLILQVVKPVRWQASITEIEKREPTVYLEIGPGTTLAGMNRKNQVTASTLSIGKVEDLKLLQGELCGS